MRVRRQDKGAFGSSEQELAVPCRYGKPPFCIQTECCSPFEHAYLSPNFPHFDTFTHFKT